MRGKIDEAIDYFMITKLRNFVYEIDVRALESNYQSRSNVMSKSDWFDGEKILQSIKEDSRKRRAAPLEFFQQFLCDIWMDNTEEEAMDQWEVKVKQGPWYAEDALYCMDAVIANPPENLVEILENEGWIILYHNCDQPDERPYTDEEHYEWLKQMRDEFRAIYDNAPVYESIPNQESTK